ncbi:hypothetical protein ROZALSC1DRAFT_26015, partial [Rozella allomycis CSF55]
LGKRYAKSNFSKLFAFFGEVSQYADFLDEKLRNCSNPYPKNYSLPPFGTNPNSRSLPPFGTNPNSRSSHVSSTPKSKQPSRTPMKDKTTLAQVQTRSHNVSFCLSLEFLIIACFLELKKHVYIWNSDLSQMTMLDIFQMFGIELAE